MKKLGLLFICFLFSFIVFASPKNDSQVIQTGHWVYDSLYMLSNEQKCTLFFTTQPMTISELKFNFSKIDYETLSSNGQKVYKKLSNFLYKDDDFLPNEDLRFFLNLKTSPEVYYKSNGNLPWTFNYFTNDFFLTMPVIFGFSNLFTIQSDMFIGKNAPSIQKNDSFCNIPYAGNQLEFLFPRFTYGSFIYAKDNWGFNFHIGKEGRQYGQTSLGSIVYNKDFETDSYALLNLYTNRFKYTLDVSQITNTQFLYLHTLDARLFKNFRISVIEGSMVNDSFELRYLIPFMVMHSYGSRFDHAFILTPTQRSYYGESGVCAYFGVNFDYTPTKNLRIYGLYAQNEMLDPGGSRTDLSLSVPDSIGLQFGLDYNFLLKNDDYLKTNIEASYTSPYLYVKYTPQTSLYRDRWDMQSGGNIISWMGSPLGPDSFALNFGLKYQAIDRFDIGLNYNFIIHGQNNASMFKTKALVDQIDKDGNQVLDKNGVPNKEDIYAYYPSVMYEIAETDEERIKARDIGRYMWMTGINEFTNRISIDATYYVNQNFKLFGKAVYTHVKNFNNKEAQTEQGIELSLGLEYKLFE